MATPIETELYDDPQAHEAKEVLGRWTRRQFVTIAVAAAVTATIVASTILLGIRVPPMAWGILVGLPVGLVGYVGLYKVNGEYVETWLPRAVEEARAPRHLVGTPPDIVVVSDGPAARDRPRLLTKEERQEVRRQRAEEPVLDRECADSYLTSEHVTYWRVHPRRVVEEEA